MTCMRQCPSGTADLGPHWDHTVCAMPNDPRICAPLACPQIAGDQRRRLTATFWGQASVQVDVDLRSELRRPLRALPSSHELGGRNPVPAAEKLNADVPVEDSGNHEEPAAPCVFVDTPSLHGYSPRGSVKHQDRHTSSLGVPSLDMTEEERREFVIRRDNYYGQIRAFRDRRFVSERTR